jgi:hypothetical protein
MRPRYAGPASASKPLTARLLIGATLALALACAVPAHRSLRAIETLRRADRTVGLVVDHDDVRALVPESERGALWRRLRDIPVTVVAVRDDLASDDESALRALGFRLLWKLRDGADSQRFAARLGAGDGVEVTGEFAMESPGMGESIAAALIRNDGFLAVVEFAPTRPLLHLPRLVPDRLVRAHLIPTRETVWPKPLLWEPRVSRAVKDRWVRLVGVRFSSSWTPERNVDFLMGLAGRLRAEGYEIGRATPLRPWPLPFSAAPLAGLTLAVLAPVAAVAALWRTRFAGALVPFTVATAGCAFAGVVVHGLVSTPAAVAGVEAARGVKIQLIAPLLLSLLVLVDGGELASFFRRRVSWGELTLAGAVLGGGVLLLLMRSGNQPALAVTDAERGFRDVLDHVLGARPRFKEFMIGHPLLIAGLYLKGRGKGFFRDGRAFLWLGGLGQMSILNTFVHAPAPLVQSLLRTFNGWWLGALIAIPLCHLLNHAASWSMPARPGTRA